MVRKTDGSLCDYASAVRCHQCFPERGPEQFFMRELWVKRHLAAVDVFTTPSRFMIEHFARWGISRASLVHVTNGQRDYSRGVAIGDDRPRRNRFGFFGQFIDAKGLHILLRAVTLLRTDGFTDFVVEINGDNIRFATDGCRQEIEAFLEAEARRPAEERIVSMNGSYQVDQLRQRMARIDWCVVPSIWWEAFGLVISEALMFKRPLIVSNIGGPAERVRNEKDGLHFDVGDAGALARALRRACEQDGLWARLAGTMAAPPSRELMVGGFLDVYRGR
jgi:glycosyltransferase involved in cell wall biosynthesis